MNEQKKLFRVTVEYEILVSAMDETEAERIANRNLHEATAGTDPDMMLASTFDFQKWAAELPPFVPPVTSRGQTLGVSAQ